MTDFFIHSFFHVFSISPDEYFFPFWWGIRFSLPENFKLALLTLELDFAKAKANRNEQVYPS